MSLTYIAPDMVFSYYNLLTLIKFPPCMKTITGKLEVAYSKVILLYQNRSVTRGPQGIQDDRDRFIRGGSGGSEL